LRFGPNPIRSPYLIARASFVAVHQFEFLRRFPVLERVEPKATLLLNSPFSPEQTWSKIPADVQQQIRDLELEVWAIDAYQVARSLGLGVRINTIMQTCFFAISKVLPKEQAIAQIKTAIEKTYGKGGRSVVERNFKAVDSSLDGLYRLEVGVCDGPPTPALVPAQAPAFVREVTARILAEQGDLLPV
ncbi:MAG: 2-oxoacid:acceptor oxidoreductase family protein, partial [Anaerolineae bacterium]|nr:2-oxoacid:acceptor oxidoreductase family protein [Anaerolineae bacterium]